MAYNGWLQFAGTEIINAARTSTYAGQRGINVACGDCGDLAASLGDPPYTTPDGDNAPWWDPAVPDSADFCGLIGLEFTGVSDGTTERNVAEFLGDGAALGAARAHSREIEVKALAIAATQAGLSAGLGWLDTALRGSACGTSCSGDHLCLYAACPTRPVDDDDPCAPHPVSRADWDPVAAGDDLVRQLFTVALTEGPTLEEQRHVNNAWVAVVSFTLTAGNPWWWRMPRQVITQLTPPDYTDVVPDYDILAATADCPAPVDCLADSPYCSGQNRPWPDEPFPGSTPGDLTLIDPCYPTEPFTARRALWRVPMTALPEWNATAPIFSLYTGSLPLHRVTLRWYANPRNRPPTGSLDPCMACSEMTIPWVPSQTRLTIDSRTHTAVVNCRGQGNVTSAVQIYGPRGGAYDWPEFDCATPLVVELLAMNNSLAADAEWSVDLAAKVGAV